jgi:hypothetical protein
VATEPDAARDRVLAARADLGEQLELMEASVRAAIDIPAKVRRSPAKAAAIAGGVGFLALKGPQRVFGAARRRVRGTPEPLPESMLPEEVEKALRSLGSDGAKVRGALERDFADYAKRSHRQRQGVQTLLMLAVVRPILLAGSKAVARNLFAADRESFSQRLAEVRERAAKARDARPDDAAGGADADALPDGAGATPS